MKRNIHLAFFILLSLSVQKLAAQSIPNSNFENWSGGLPVGWYGDPTFVVQDTEAYQGNYAVELVVKPISGFYTSAELETGDGTTGFFAAAGRPDSFYFWYIFNTSNNKVEYFQVVSTGINTSLNLTATGALNDSTVTLVYKQGVLGFQYSAPTGDLDSMSISFNIYAPSGTDSGDIGGTYLIIDDLSFNGITGVNNLPGNGLVTIESVQPNPASDRTAIIYNLPSAANVTLDIYDITGRKVSTLVNGKQTSGTYKAILQTNNLPAGNYFCKLNADGMVTTDKIVVVK